MRADARRITFFMDNIPFIFDDTTDFPYVGLIQQEKEISESLVSMPLDYLRQNYEAFDGIVGILMASHIDVGRAYITEENEAPFLEFSRRLPAAYEAPDHLKPDSGGIFDMRYETLRRRRERTGSRFLVNRSPSVPPPADGT